MGPVLPTARLSTLRSSRDLNSQVRVSLMHCSRIKKCPPVCVSGQLRRRQPSLLYTPLDTCIFYFFGGTTKTNSLPITAHVIILYSLIAVRETISVSSTYSTSYRVRTPSSFYKATLQSFTADPFSYFRTRTRPSRISPSLSKSNM